MIDKIIEFAMRQRLLVILLAVAIVGGGYVAFNQLPIDAFPDVSPVLVQINTESEGLSPEEMEKLVTYPIEVAMNGLPGITRVQSMSTFGLSVVSIYFKDDVDIYFARQLVFERLEAARGEIPEGMGDPEMGPITTGLGQVYQYIVEGDGYDLMELRSIEDWIVKFQLRTVPGVTEILSFGGNVKQYQIQVDPNLLIKYDVTLDELIETVEANNFNAGGSYIERGSEEFLVRGLGWVENLRDIENIKLKVHQGTPIFVRDVAKVTLGPEIRRGVVTRNAEGEVVTGIVLKLIYTNTSQVIDAIKKKVEEINKSLPAGVVVKPYYDQADLVAKAIDTVKDALLEGGVLVVAVLLLFLGNLRSAIIVTVTLPLSVLIAFILMKQIDMSANLMSLGGLAIGIGMMVDGSVVMVENIFRHLSERREDGDAISPLQIILESAREVGRPIVFAISIIIIVFLPLFTLEGVEGKLFSPMAYTISFALAGSLVLALVLVPVLCSFLLTRKLKHTEIFVLRFLKRVYKPVLEKAVDRRGLTVAIAFALLIGSLALFPFLGTEFVPILDEGSILIRVTTAPSTSLKETTRITRELERILLRFPEAKNVISKIGRAELGGDPEPVNNSEIFVELAPESEWTTAGSKEELIEAMEKELLKYPGILLNFSQPIAMRVDELLSGVRAQIAIKLFGDDLDVLEEKGNQISAVVRTVRGAADVKVEQVSGQPQIQIQVQRDKIARYGINVEEVQDVIRSLVGGTSAGQVFEGQQRYDIFVRLQKPFRKDIEALKNLLISAPNGSRIPLSQLAEVTSVIGPKQISREANQRRLVIQLNVRGRDMGGFVEEARQLVNEKVELPPGYFVTWGGQFENQERAMRRLSIIVPLTIALIFLMLFLTFNSLRQAAMIILNVPFALIGGIFALFVSGQYLSVPASVGFIALFGVAVLNGVVLVSYINQLRREGQSLKDAVINGSMLRLRPVLMTALVASLGLVPLLLSTGTGSEVQRPLASVVIGGLVTSTLLTLVVLPTIYGWFEKKQEAVEI
ncbi:MAG: efflux RND transporter permease subunit [bacterium]